MFNLLSYIFEIAHVFEGFDHNSLHVYIESSVKNLYADSGPSE